jgi:hypothetical protein
MTITVLSLLAAEVIRLVSIKYQSALQTATWQEALLAAESGIDLSIVELRKSLLPGTNHSWDGWNNTTDNGVDNHALTTILSGTSMTIEANVDAPTSFVDPHNGWQYYRIRTVGTMPITGPATVADNKQDNRLRKLSLRWERFTGGILTSRAFKEGEGPHVSRRIEAVVRPVSSFNQAIMSVGTIDLTNQNIVVDSYDSTDPTKSTDGLYDETKRQENGDIATDGNLIEAGNAHIYGDVATNSGTVSGAANVTGTERDDFYQEPIPVGAPTWASFNSTVTNVTNTTTLNGSPTSGASISRYQLSSINLSGGKTLTLAGNADGSPSYIEIYVTGDISFSGTSQLIVKPGVTAKVYFQGNVDVGGNGILNSNNQPSDLQLFGIQPLNDTPRHVNLGGNGQIVAAIYAPSHDITINGGGTDGHVFGSVIGNTVTMTGVTNLHYDEKLSSLGMINSYKIVSWFEESR